MLLTFPLNQRMGDAVMAMVPPGTIGGEPNWETGTFIAQVPMTREIAKRFDAYTFEHQRKLDTAQVHHLHNDRLNQLWFNNNTLHYAVLMTPKGVIVSVHNINGQHTIKMLTKLKPGEKQNAIVRIDIAFSLEQIGLWYSKIDAGKSRGQSDANRSMQIHRRIGFNQDTKEITNFCDKATAAATYLAGGLRLHRRDSPVDADSKDTKMAVAIGFKSEIQQLYGLLAPVRERVEAHKKSRDARVAAASKVDQEFLNGCTRAPVMASLLAGLRYRQTDMTAFIEAVVAVYLSPVGSDETPRGRSFAAYQATAVTEAMNYLLTPVLNYNGNKRPHYAFWTLEHFFAYRRGRKLSLTRTEDVSPEVIDDAWVKLTGSPFCPAALNIDDLPLRHPVIPTATASVPDAGTLRMTFPADLHKAITRPRRRSKLLQPA